MKLLSIPELHFISEEIIERVGDPLVQALIRGGMRAGFDAHNPTPLMHFATSFREVYIHILALRSPVEKVKSCSWFEQDVNVNGVNRRQRAQYAAHGGLHPDFVNEIGADISDALKDLTARMRALNDLTHIKESQLVLSREQQKQHIQITLFELKQLLDSFETCRKEVCDVLLDEVYKTNDEAFSTEYLEELDLISGRGYEIDPWVDDATVEISDITESTILLKFSGVLHATMHYGGKHDVATASHSFPFKSTLEASVTTPRNPKYRGCEIDDSSWYE